MCGFAGFINISRQQFTADESLLHKMQEKIAHRGPDAWRVWKSDDHQLGLAFRRLSIIDLSDAGMQPMFAQDRSVVVCFNGEIYNHEAVRKELQQLGYQYSSTSDTETIIYAYKEWGIAGIEKLDGMFAIVLYDFNKRQLYLIRDRIGVKPLYFSLQGGVLSFASEIKALWELPWMEKTYSAQALYHYLTFMVAPAPLTVFNSVYKLPAGFYAVLNEHKQLAFKEWYTPITAISQTQKKEFANEAFCIENIRNLLALSAKKRMVADVPVGAFLSGGVDSSLNVALMAACVGKVQTFTVAFADGPESNELLWARLIAKQFGTDHHELTISEKEAFSFYERMVYHLDEPLADCVCIPFYYVSKLARDSGVKVVQVGEGADELFFGYPTYGQYKKVHDAGYASTQQFIPAFAKKAVHTMISPFLKSYSERLSVLDNWAYDKNLFWGGALAFNERQKRGFFADIQEQVLLKSDYVVEQMMSGVRQEYDSNAFVDYHLGKLRLVDKDADFCKQMLYLELKQRLPELLLMRADKMSMATSVEAREPYLDYRLIEFMMHVPAELRFKNGETKYLLKKVCEGVLPHNVIYRKKVGFAAPTFRWFKEGRYFPTYFKKMHAQAGARADMPIFPAALVKKNMHSNQLGLAVQKWVLQNMWAMK